MNLLPTSIKKTLLKNLIIWAINYALQKLLETEERKTYFNSYKQKLTKVMDLCLVCSSYLDDGKLEKFEVERIEDKVKQLFNDEENPPKRTEL